MRRDPLWYVLLFLLGRVAPDFGIIVVRLLGMGRHDDPNVLPGPHFPLWGCRCGSTSNWASRIKCKCGAPAPTRVIQAAKREAASIKSQPANAGAPRAKGKWANGPPKHNDELAKLRAEVAQLRESAKTNDVDAEEVDEEEPTIDLQKAHAAYQATVAAFGADSKRAKEMDADVQKLRTAKQQGKSLSAQIGAAERKVRDKDKKLESAKLAAVAAAEAVREAKRHLEEADAKVVQSVASLQDAQKSLRDLSSRPAEPLQETPADDHSALLLKLGTDFQEDNEAAQAVALLRTKMAAKASTQEAERIQVRAEGTALPARSDMDVDVVELERQAAAAKRQSEQMDERVQKAKAARIC